MSTFPFLYHVELPSLEMLVTERNGPSYVHRLIHNFLPNPLSLLVNRLTRFYVLLNLYLVFFTVGCNQGGPEQSLYQNVRKNARSPVRH